MLYLILFYFILIFLAIIFEKKHIYYFLIFTYFSIIFFRLTYPWLFGFSNVESILFLLSLIILCSILRFFPLLLSLFISFFPSSFKNEKSLIKKIADVFLNFLKNKEKFFRKIFPKNLWFFYFYNSRQFFSKIPKTLLILFFFVPQLTFVLFLFLESFSASFSYTLYLFSLKLIFSRVYPKILVFSLGWGNLYHLYIETVDNNCFPLTHYRLFTQNFFSEALSLWVTFLEISRLSLAVAIFGSNLSESKNYINLCKKQYNRYFFPARNWMLVCWKLNCFKLRFFSLDICLFLVVIFYKSFLYFYFRDPFFKFYFYFILFWSVVFFWIFFNRKMFSSLFFYYFSEKRFLDKILPVFNDYIKNLKLFPLIINSSFVNNSSSLLIKKISQKKNL